MGETTQEIWSKLAFFHEGPIGTHADELPKIDARCVFFRRTQNGAFFAAIRAIRRLPRRQKSARDIATRLAIAHV